ncbi:MAG TPA: YaiO family outer membrane beta-barrel protein [Burkholderiales bacterium]|jgi:YaiO family outer membrane protein|nr:YaiO family outer membrane beta-barrel protein [Burkholderiales bacterium]
MRLVLLLLAFVAGPAAALEMEGGFTKENLTNNKPDWKSIYLEAAHDFAKRQTLYGGVRETERFDFRDTELAAGYYHPFTEHLTAQIEGSHSSSHNVLPENSLFTAASWELSKGWVASGGVRYNQYTDNDSRVLNAGIERYFGNYRLFYGIFNGKPQGAPSASAQRLGLDYYYGEKSRIGAGITWGREVEYVGPPTGIITSDVRAVSVYGRHWFTPAWAVSWEALRQEQGDLYTRTGIRLGLRHLF